MGARRRWVGRLVVVAGLAWTFWVVARYVPYLTDHTTTIPCRGWPTPCTTTEAARMAHEGTLLWWGGVAVVAVGVALDALAARRRTARPLTRVRPLGHALTAVLGIGVGVVLAALSLVGASLQESGGSALAHDEHWLVLAVGYWAAALAVARLGGEPHAARAAALGSVALAAVMIAGDVLAGGSGPAWVAAAAAFVLVPALLALAARPWRRSACLAIVLVLVLAQLGVALATGH